MAISKEERRKIRQNLPQGSINLISNTLHMSRCSVYKWFVGRNNSPRVGYGVLECLKMIDEKKRKTGIDVHELFAKL